MMGKRKVFEVCIHFLFEKFEKFLLCKYLMSARMPSSHFQLVTPRNFFHRSMFANLFRTFLQVSLVRTFLLQCVRLSIHIYLYFLVAMESNNVHRSPLFELSLLLSEIFLGTLCQTLEEPEALLSLFSCNTSMINKILHSFHHSPLSSLFTLQ